MIFSIYFKGWIDCNFKAPRKRQTRLTEMISKLNFQWIRLHCVTVHSSNGTFYSYHLERIGKVMQFSLALLRSKLCLISIPAVCFFTCTWRLISLMNQHTSSKQQQTKARHIALLSICKQVHKQTKWFLAEIQKCLGFSTGRFNCMVYNTFTRTIS